MTTDPLDGTAFDDAAGFIADVVESSTERSIVAVDDDGVIVLWNEGARRFYGYERSEITGKSWSALYTAEDVQAGLPALIMRDALEEGKWEGTVRRVRKDGSRFTARVVVTPRRGAHGRSGGFVFISSDISEEERLAGDLERAQAYTRSLLESAPDAMVIINDRGEMQLTNAETERLFGYTRAELIGEPVELLMPERYQRRHPDHRGRFSPIHVRGRWVRGLICGAGARTGSSFRWRSV